MSVLAIFNWDIQVSHEWQSWGKHVFSHTICAKFAEGRRAFACTYVFYRFEFLRDWFPIVLTALEMNVYLIINYTSWIWLTSYLKLVIFNAISRLISLYWVLRARMCDCHIYFCRNEIALWLFISLFICYILSCLF